MRICWICNYFSPYAIKRFDELGKNNELTIFALGGKDDNRNDEWEIKSDHTFKVINIDNKFFKEIYKNAKYNDVLIDALYSSVYGVIAVQAFKKENKKVLMLADGGIAVDRGMLINKTLSFLMKRHDYFLSSSIYTNNYYKYYGVDENNIYQYRFSSLTNDDIFNNKLLSVQKNKMRLDLGIDNKFTLISVGQPIKRKGFDILLRSYIESGLANLVNLYIVGGKPQDDIKEIVENNRLTNVYFVDLIDSTTLKKYYAASDAFILCTREDIWGLVIEEAMSFGLPIITSNNCVAGLHFSDICKSVRICDVSNTNQYANEIKNLFDNKDNIKELSGYSFDAINGYSIENSANDIIDVLNSI